MQCSKCQGLVANIAGEVKCYNCGKQYFQPDPPGMTHSEQVTWWKAHRCIKGRGGRFYVAGRDIKQYV